MADEVSTTTTEAVKKMSDGSVKLSLEAYNTLVEKAAEKAPVIHRTVVNKTTEMLEKEHRVWGGTLMGLGASFFVIGALRYAAGKS